MFHQKSKFIEKLLNPSKKLIYCCFNLGLKRFKKKSIAVIQMLFAVYNLILSTTELSLNISKSIEL